MAGSGRKVFAPGEVLTATNVQNYLMDQAVQVYADSASRGSAIGTATTEGMVSWLSDVNTMQVATGTATWQDVSLVETPNAIINGAFDIWQRGTSFTNPNAAYTADRWVSGRDSTTTSDISRQTFSPGTAPVSGYEGTYFLRATGTVVSSNAFYVLQRLEDVRSFAGQTVTLSYWAKANTNVNSTPIYIQNFGSGGSSSVISSSLATHAITTSWQRFSVTFNVPSISGKTVGTSSLLELQVIRCASTATIDLWGVQIEAGYVATPFRRHAPSLQGELAACQRYYFRKNAGATAGVFGAGFNSSSTVAYAFIPFPVEMRTAPSTTLDWTGTAANYRILYLNTNADLTATPTIDSTISTTTGVRINATTAAVLTGGQGIMLISSLAGGSYLGFSAEL